VNRVEGLAAGAGFVWRTPDDGFEIRGLGSYGFADSGHGNRRRHVDDGLELAAYRQVRDIGDGPVIAPLLNSIASQEFGDDYGDYYRAIGMRVGLRRGIGARGEWHVAAAHDASPRSRSAPTPATGRYRFNPAVHDGYNSVGTLTLRRRKRRVSRSAATSRARPHWKSATTTPASAARRTCSCRSAPAAY